MRHYFLATLSYCCYLLWASSRLHAAPVLRVMQGAQAGTPRLVNGDFETVANNVPASWQPFGKGFRLAPGAGRGGRHAIVCENSAGQGAYGAMQTITLDQTASAPVLVRGWSKAENVNGSADTGYSLYVDIIYTDGTPLWGQTANFRTGTHDWQERELTIVPAKPIKSINLYCLLRGHTGQVWFDDVAVSEIKVRGGIAIFQGLPVAVVPPAPATKPAVVRTQDGLQLNFNDNTVTGLQVNRQNLSAPSPGGFMARDVAANSDFYNFAGGTCPELGLQIQPHITASPDHITVQGRLTDTRRTDRATTLVFALPLDAVGWHWGDDMRRNRVIQRGAEYSTVAGIGCGSTGTMSLYPLAALWNHQAGLAIALDMAYPAQYRLAYNAGTRQLLIAYDFGLVPETRAPEGADFQFVIYRFDPQWGWRAALQKLYGIFPDYFRVRATDQGIWMPFTDISTVQGWQDFGFKYHEGNNNVAFDNAHGILPFRYTEPSTWWMPMPPNTPRTLAAAQQIRDNLAGGKDDTARHMAQASVSAGMTDEAGQPELRFINAPWNNGAVWSLNPNPYLPTPTGQYNAATVYWNDTIKQQLYGAEAKGHPAGEYLDSLEAYATADLNFRRDHFRYAAVPLTFDSETKRPALYKGFEIFEFTHWLAQDVHGLGKLMFANSVPDRYSFLCSQLDVMGTETNWLMDGKYQPETDERLSLCRAMSYDKPYLLLMNTDFDAFTFPMMEKYFQRSLFYGIFPSMFSPDAATSPYWQNPTWYNRDRPLFKKYIPLIKRITTAGWQPVTSARCDNAHIYVERCGPTPDGICYLTFLNDTAQAQSGEVAIDPALLKLPTAQELISGHALSLTANRLHITLQPQEAQLIQIQ